MNLDTCQGFFSVSSVLNPLPALPSRTIGDESVCWIGSFCCWQLINAARFKRWHPETGASYEALTSCAPPKPLLTAEPPLLVIVSLLRRRGKKGTYAGAESCVHYLTCAFISELSWKAVSFHSLFRHGEREQNWYFISGRRVSNM